MRQALRKGKSILLEPYYTFKIEVPSQSFSKVLYELEQRNASFEILETEEDMSTIQGSGAIRLLMNFQSELSALSKGRGKITIVDSIYKPSQDTESIVKTIQYDPEADLKHPTGSIFCKQGAGYYVPYDEVEEKCIFILSIQSRAILMKECVITYRMRKRNAHLKERFQKRKRNQRRKTKSQARTGS